MSQILLSPKWHQTEFSDLQHLQQISQSGRFCVNARYLCFNFYVGAANPLRLKWCIYVTTENTKKIIASLDRRSILMSDETIGSEFFLKKVLVNKKLT